MTNPLEAALRDRSAEEFVVEAPAEASTEAPAEAQAAPESPPQAETPPAQPPAAPPGHVPLSAMLDEREQRQAAQKALKELQERLERQRTEWLQQNPPNEGERLELQRYADNLRFSRRFAEREYGKELVQQVHDWVSAKCDADPLFNEQMRRSDDPYEAAVRAFRREDILAQVDSGEFEAFKAWKAAQAAATSQAPTPQPAPRAVTPPPRSLATAPGTGAAGAPAVSVGDGEAYQSLFRR